MKQDKALRPIHISFLNANVLIPRAQMAAHAVQNLGGRGAVDTGSIHSMNRSKDDAIRKILGLPKQRHQALSLNSVACKFFWQTISLRMTVV